MGIAERRHELKKKKKKALSFGESYAKLYNHLANCSCWMCGNPRKFFKQRTIKETLHDDWKKLEKDWSEI